MRFLPTSLLAPVLAVALSGCGCGVEKAAGIATKGKQEGEAGNHQEALRRLAEAGKCVEGDMDDDLEARFLVAAIFFRMHSLGAPSSFPPGDEFDWARRRLSDPDTGAPTYLALAFREFLTLEEKTFTVERIPAWATVDRLLIAADAILANSDALVAELPAETFQKAGPDFAAAQMRLAVLDVVRGFCFQAWHRALEAGEPVDPARKRVLAVYHAAAEVSGKLAEAAAIEGAQVLKRDAEKERDRFRALEERAAIVITPDELHDNFDREMLKLVSTDHTRPGRKLGNRGFEEKQAGNRERATASMRSALSHFNLALTIGVDDPGEKRNSITFMRDLIYGLRELEK